MSAVVRCNVEVLHIHICIDEELLQLPQCLSVSISLTTLDLCVCCTLKFLPSICVSNLKHLHLAHITFTDDGSTQKLFSDCPALETVCLAKCNWTNLCSVGLYAPKLLILEITEDVTEGTYFEESHDCEVMIFAPSLQTFKYDGAFLNDYCVYDSPTLNEAVIHFGSKEWVERPRIVFYWLFKLLKGISNLKQLLLSSDIVEELNFAVNPLPYMPCFHNLSTLTFSKGIIELDCEAIMRILQCSPSLENLCFKAGIKLSSHCKNDKRILESSTPDFLPRLKTVEVWENGNNKKLFVDAIEILLKRFGVLDKLIVYAKEIGGYKEELKKELLELPKASKVCQILVLSSEEDKK